ncbi:MAG: WxcM-like domain-containing protein [Aurantibacter sp.]
MADHNLLRGNRFSDERGVLNFFNSFDMGKVVRLYEIVPSSIETIRAWQGHKEEKKWFYCNSGGFIVNLIKLDNFERPSEDLIPFRFELFATEPTVLEVQGGYATGFKATVAGSKLLVFSNFSVDESKEDDFRYPINQWSANWQN